LPLPLSASPRRALRGDVVVQDPASWSCTGTLAADRPPQTFSSSSLVLLPWAAAASAAAAPRPASGARDPAGDDKEEEYCGPHAARWSSRAGVGAGASASFAAVDVRGDEKFAALAHAAVRACATANKVQGLRMAARDARRRRRAAGRRVRRLAIQRSEECQRTFLARHEVDVLREEVEELRLRAGVGAGDCAARQAAQLDRGRAAAAEALREARAREEALQLLHAVVLAVARKLPACSRDGAMEGERGSDAPKQSRGPSRGLSWASKLPEIGTPLASPEIGTPSASLALATAAARGSCQSGPSTPEQEDADDDKISAALDNSLHRRRPRRTATIVCLDDLDDSGTNEDQVTDSQFTRLRFWLDMSLCSPRRSDPFARRSAEERSVEAAPRPHGLSFWSSSSSSSSSTPSQAMKPDSPSTATSELVPELRELLAIVLFQTPKLLSSGAPEEVRRAIEGLASRARAGKAPPEGFLTVTERARLLREGVVQGVVDPSLLAAHLGKPDEMALRTDFFAQWVAGWLGPYLKDRCHIFGPAPQAEKRFVFARSGMRTPAQQYGRQCGRVVVDGMRDLFGRAMRLVNVEQESLTRLLEEFAHVLCEEPEIRSRFQFVELPPEERPKDVESLEHAVFLLAYHTLLLNTAMHNTSAKGKAPSRAEFAAQGRAVAGVREDFCKKMFDLIRTQPL